VGWRQDTIAADEDAVDLARQVLQQLGHQVQQSPPHV
jgi:hypothetical protein